MKSVRLLFLEIAALLSFSILVIFFLEWKYKSYETQADILMKEYQRKKTDAEILWLGNSHTIPLVAEMDSLGIHTPCVSFAYGGMDLFWSAVLYEKYRNEIPHLKTLCIGVDEELLGYNQTKFKLEYINRSLYKYTDTLDDDSPVNRLLAGSNFFRTNRDISYLFNLRNQPSDLKPMLHGFFRQGDQIQQCKERAKENTFSRFSGDLIQDNISLLKQILQTARIHGDNVILFTTPKSPCYNSFRNTRAIESSRIAMRKFVEEEHTFYLNGNDLFRFPDSLFRDADHLNMHGAKIFLDSLNAFCIRQTGEKLFVE